MRFRVLTYLSALALSLSLVACGGGGGDAPPSGDGGSAPTDDTTPQAFSISGTWRAMSMAGIYSVSIDGGNGVIEFMRPDEITGAMQKVVVGGMIRGSDGAYIFQSGLVAGGLPLNVALYQVDNNTMAGQILSSRNNSLQRAPVILTRSTDTDLSALPGDWVSNDVACFFEQSKGHCESAFGPTEVSEYEAGFVSLRLSTNSLSFCFDDMPISVSDCAPEKIKAFDIADLGNGLFDFLGEKAFVFHVGGDDLMFNHGFFRQSDTLVYMGLSARDVALAPEALNGEWRIATEDGRTGVVTVNADNFTAEIEGRDPVRGKLTRNHPLRSISVLEIEGQTYPYYWIGNEKLALVNGNEGYFLLHRN